MKTSKTTSSKTTTKGASILAQVTEGLREAFGLHYADAELHHTGKQIAIELGQNASNASRTARTAIASLKTEKAPAHEVITDQANDRALAAIEKEGPIVKKGRVFPASFNTGKPEKTGKAPTNKGATYVFRVIATNEYIADKTQPLTPKKAARINAQLELDNSEGRWVPIEVAKQNGKPTTLAQALAARNAEDIPTEIDEHVEAADPAENTEAQPAAALANPVLTVAALQLLQRLTTEPTVIVSGTGLPLAVTAGFLAKKGYVTIDTIANDRVAAITQAGKDAVAFAAANPKALGRLSSPPQWVVKRRTIGAEKFESIGRNNTHRLAIGRADADAGPKAIVWHTAFSGNVAGKAEYRIDRAGGVSAIAALDAEQTAEASAEKISA